MAYAGKDATDDFVMLHRPGILEKVRPKPCGILGVFCCCSFLGSFNCTALYFKHMGLYCTSPHFTDGYNRRRFIF